MLNKVVFFGLVLCSLSFQSATAQDEPGSFFPAFSSDNSEDSNFDAAMTLFRSSEPSLHAQGLRMLEENISKDNLEQVKKLYKASAGLDKAELLAVLIRHGEDDFIGQLGEYREHDSALARMRLAYNARYLKGNLDAARELTRWLNDKDNFVREYAVKSIGEIGRYEVLSDLQNMLSSGVDDSFVRNQLNIAIGKLERAQQREQEAAESGMLAPAPALQPALEGSAE